MLDQGISHDRISITRKGRKYHVVIDGTRECIISEREILKHIATIPYDEDRISIDDVVTNKYYILHVLAEACILKTMGYSIGEKLYEYVEQQDLWRAHLEALDIELSYALRNGDIDWVKTRVKALEESIEEGRVPDTVIEEALLMVKKWNNMLSELER